MHRMRAAGFGQPDRARDADLAPLRVELDLAAGRDRRDLQAPARAEERLPGGEDRAGEIDLGERFRLAPSRG